MPQRPRCVTILSIIGLVWGGLSLLLAFYALAAMLLRAGLPTESGSIESDPLYQNVTLITICIGIPISLLLIAGSIGSLFLKRPARLAMLAYAPLAILHKISTVLFAVLYTFPRMAQEFLGNNPTPFERDIAHVGYYVAVFGVCTRAITLALPICILYFYTRPHVARAFQNLPRETPAEFSNALSPE